MKHGTRTCYEYHKCRCDECRAANTKYNREWERHKRRMSYGIEEPRPARYVDATEAREHLLWLSTIGIGRRTVHEHSGVSLSTIQKIKGGRNRLCEPWVLKAILAVNATQRPSVSRIDGTRTLAQIDELLAHGMTKRAIARYLTGNPTTNALQVRGPWVNKGTADRIEDLWRRVLAPEIARRELERDLKRDYRARKAAA